MHKEKKIFKYEKPVIVPLDSLKQVAMGECKTGSVAILEPK